MAHGACRLVGLPVAAGIEDDGGRRASGRTTDTVVGRRSEGGSLSRQRRGVGTARTLLSMPSLGQRRCFRWPPPPGPQQLECWKNRNSKMQRFRMMMEAPIAPVQSVCLALRVAQRVLRAHSDHHVDTYFLSATEAKSGALCLEIQIVPMSALDFPSETRLIVLRGDGHANEG